ncbi:MAG TPA: proline dehydrogenase family protein [Candidatus Limnocylindrales bacterium]|nr:proline dehydrogenase family protein [Candidatus Limnocylindrales bacterium]
MTSAAALGLPELPARALRVGFLWASRRRTLGRLAASTRLTRSVVQRFVPGESLDEALPALQRLRRAGLRTTVDLLGESVESILDGERAADRYVQALDTLAARGLDRNVSIKLTQMGLDVDPASCRANVARIVTRAAELGAFVRIDMEDHERLAATIALAREVRAQHRDVGVVIQSYLRRSADDVEALIAEGIRVRLCKGAYNESVAVAFPTKQEVDDSYRRLAERLLRDGNYPAIATHDQRLIEYLRRFAAREGISPVRFEFQMLYGIRRDLQRSLVRDGYTVRVYVPVGTEWFPYFMRRLAERPANALFVLRSVVSEGRPGR